MGNVLATSKPITSGLPVPGDLPPPEPVPGTGLNEKKSSPLSELVTKLENPGPFEELHKKCKGMIIFVDFKINNFFKKIY